MSLIRIVVVAIVVVVALSHITLFPCQIDFLFPARLDVWSLTSPVCVYECVCFCVSLISLGQCALVSASDSKMVFNYLVQLSLLCKDEVTV